MQTIETLIQQYFLHILAVVFIFVSCLEMLRPRVERKGSILKMWLTNYGMFFFNSALVRGILLVIGFEKASEVANLEWGLFHQIALPYWLVALLCLLVLDVKEYVRHRTFHGPEQVEQIDFCRDTQ